MSKPDWTQFNFLGHTISNTKVEAVNNCGLKYKFNYEDKIPTMAARALELGRCFDRLCESGEVPDDLKLLSQQDIEVIKERYEEYLPIMPVGKKQVGFQKDVGYKDWSLIGFMDLVPDAFPDAPIVEIKFSEKKWTQKKAGYKWLQAAIYAWAMEHDWVQFHVMNYEKPGLQTYDMNISEIETDRMLDDVVSAIRKIEDGVRSPEENVLCGWCNYQNRCPLFDTTSKETTDGTDINKDSN